MLTGAEQFKLISELRKQRKLMKGADGRQQFTIISEIRRIRQLLGQNQPQPKQEPEPESTDLEPVEAETDDRLEKLIRGDYNSLEPLPYWDIVSDLLTQGLLTLFDSYAPLEAYCEARHAA